MIKKFFRNLLTPLIIFILILIFFLTYSVSLIIIKPRDITQIIRLVENRLKNEHNIYIKRAEISWDKKKFTFDINLLQTTINKESFSVFIPILTLDISRRNLFLKKLAIDRISIPKLLVNLNNNNAKKQKIKISIDSLKNDISSYLTKEVSSLSIFKKIEIQYLELVNNNITHKIKDIKFKLLDNKYQKATDLSFAYYLSENNPVTYESLCLLDEDFIIEKCDITANNIQKKFLNYSFLPDNFDFSKLDFDLTIINNGNLKFTSNINIDNLSFNENGSHIFYPKINITKEFIHANNIDKLLLKITNQEKILNFHATSNKVNNDLKLNLSGSYFSDNEIYLLWPKVFAGKVRDWLEKSLYNTDLDSFYINIDLDKAHKKLKNINGEFNLRNGNLKFAKNIKPLKEIRAKILLNNETIKISTYEAKIGSDIIRDFNSNIDYKVKPLALDIAGKLDGTKANNIIEFLLAKKLTKLKESFSNSNLFGDLKIDLKITKPFSLKNISINYIGDIAGEIKDFAPKDSVIKLKLNKNFSTNNFKIDADLESAYFTLPYIKTIKDRNRKLNAQLNIIPTKENLEFSDIIVKNEDINIKGFIKFTKGKLAQISFNNVKFYENKFNINLALYNNILFGNISADQINFDEKFLLKPPSNESKFLNLDLLINKLYFYDNPFHVAGKINCNAICKLIYIEGLFKENNYAIYKETSNKKHQSQLDITTNNFGALLEYINLTDKVKSGYAHIEVKKNKNSYQEGKLLVQNFTIKYENFLSKIKNLGPFKKQNIEDLYFEKAEANFSYNYEEVIIKDSLLYGNILGVTLNGKYDKINSNYDLNGYLIPAYKLNNLFGISQIPVIGKVLTGRDNQGLISAKFTIKGNKNNQELKVNPFSAFIPSAFKSLKNLFKKNND